MALDPIEINFDTFKYAVQTIAAQIEASYRTYDIIIAPNRGGLIPGVMLSHHFNIPLVPIIYSTRDFVQPISPSLYATLKLYVEDFPINALLIEDIIDSGKTIADLLVDIREMFGQSIEVDVAAIMTNTTNAAGIDPEYPAMIFDKTKEDRWVNFFYEKVAE